jgi:hypothetical protein
MWRINNDISLLLKSLQLNMEELCALTDLGTMGQGNEV